MVLRLSLKARRAYGRLLRPYNDCDVYVEDESLIGVHETVINAALKGRGSVSRVIPLGPRKAVLEAACNDRSAGGRPRLYVIDGDLEAIWRRRRRSAPHLYVLKVYEFENLLATRERLEVVAAASLTRHPKLTALAIVDIPGLMSEISFLRPYFVLLAVAQKLGLGGSVFSLNPPSVSRKQKGLCVGVDIRKVHARCLAISRAICVKVGLRKFTMELKTTRRYLDEKKYPGPVYVPGRKFILYYFRNRISANRGVSHSDSSVCGMLSLDVDFSYEKEFKKRLRQLL